MKKPSRGKKGVLSRLAERRWHQRLKSEAKRRRLRARGRPAFTSRFAAEPTRESTGTKQEPIRLTLPAELDLIRNYDESVTFINDLHRAARDTRERVILDFAKVERIRPTALLLLLAELHRCRLVYSTQRVTGMYPPNAAVERMLEATGFFRLINVRHRGDEPERTFPLEHIHFISDKTMEGDRIRGLREKLFGGHVIMPELARSALYRSVSEAITNVCQHAYPPGHALEHPGRNRWWLAGTVNRLRKDLTITFCDLGVGIPSTLPKLYPWEVIRAILAVLPGVKPNDGDMIRAAMTLGRSATHETNRGKGLNDLRKFVDIAGAGELVIFSNRGSYRYGANGEEQVVNYDRSIGGTLIKWTVPMARVTDWKGDDDEPNTTQDT